MIDIIGWYTADLLCVFLLFRDVRSVIILFVEVDILSAWMCVFKHLDVALFIINDYHSAMLRYSSLAALKMLELVTWAYKGKIIGVWVV